jgi:predicted NAD-dependent protein-ADP-ribosyltransferase YbiA (DUF1768 family)
VEDSSDQELALLEDLLRQKFSAGKFRALLTQHCEGSIRFEGPGANTRSGVIQGVGANLLGNLLMQIRDELQASELRAGGEEEEVQS